MQGGVCFGEGAVRPETPPLKLGCGTGDDAGDLRGCSRLKGQRGQLGRGWGSTEDGSHLGGRAGSAPAVGEGSALTCRQWKCQGYRSPFEERVYG